MFDLVADVPRYPEFLPWCDRSEVLSSSDREVIARVGVAYHGIRKSFTTRNSMSAAQRIGIALVDGPFSHLNGVWTFDPIESEACRVSLTLEFGFTTRILDKLLGPVFKHIANSMVGAFCQRATNVYPAGGVDPG